MFWNEAGRANDVRTQGDPREAAFGGAYGKAENARLANEQCASAELGLVRLAVFVAEQPFLGFDIKLIPIPQEALKATAGYDRDAGMRFALDGQVHVAPSGRRRGEAMEEAYEPPGQSCCRLRAGVRRDRRGCLLG